MGAERARRIVPSPRRSLLLRDILEHPGRTLLVVLSIAAGIFVIGVIGSTRAGLDRAIGGPYAASRPPTVIVATDLFDDALVAAVRRLPGVAAADGRGVLRARLQTGPNQWVELELAALRDFTAQQVDLIGPETGDWPPADHELLIERGSLALTGAAVGDRVVVEIPGGRRRTMRIGGLAHQVLKPPAQFTGVAQAYVTLNTLTWLGEGRAYNQLLVIGDEAGRAAALTLAGRVERQVEQSGRTVYASFLPTPGKHPSQEIIDPLLLLLGNFGLMSLAMSAFLIVNTIAGILRRHVRQIGVMKAVGARTDQLLQLYLGMALAYGAMAVLLAAPLAAVAAHLFTGYLAGLVDVDPPGFGVPLAVLAQQIALGLLTPLLAALAPALLAVRITVREALSGGDGGAPPAGRGWAGATWVRAALGRLTARVSRPVRLSLRNTFRRRGRLLFTLSALTLSGAMFISVFSLRASVLRALADAEAYRAYDIAVELDEAPRTRVLAQTALRTPGVVAVEGLGLATVRLRLADGAATPPLDMLAVPAATDFLRPVLVEGRWLLPEDDNALVLNTAVLDAAPGLRVGDTVTLRRGPHDEERWHVVGMVRSVLDGPQLFANQPYAQARSGETNRARTLLVRTASAAPEDRAAVAAALDAAYTAAGVRVALVETTDQAVAALRSQFDIVLAFMLVMALIIAAVGGLGLSGTMSMSTLERTREIGVLRAVGASDGAVRRVVVVEGVVIGVLSWALSVVAAAPLGWVLTVAVGEAFLNAPIAYVYAPLGAAGWLAGVVLLAAAASLAPARRAARLRVREVLAYE